MFLLFYCENILSINLWVSGSSTAMNVSIQFCKMILKTLYTICNLLKKKKNLPRLKILNFKVMLIKEKKKKKVSCGVLFIMIYKYENVWYIGHVS